MSKILGYTFEDDLPVKRGDAVIIRKGVVISTTRPPDMKDRVAKKTFKIKVHHVLPGSMYTEADMAYQARNGYDLTSPTSVVEKDGKKYYVRSNPEVRWVGSGGYWHGVDINDVLFDNSLRIMMGG